LQKAYSVPAARPRQAVTLDTVVGRSEYKIAKAIEVQLTITNTVGEVFSELAPGELSVIV